MSDKSFNLFYSRRTTRASELGVFLLTSFQAQLPCPTHIFITFSQHPISYNSFIYLPLKHTNTYHASKPLRISSRLDSKAYLSNIRFVKNCRNQLKLWNYFNLVHLRWSIFNKYWASSRSLYEIVEAKPETIYASIVT